MTDIRARITAGELVVVLSHYDLGLIESVSRFRGGSRQSPKVLVVSDRGRFLLKRRAAGAGSGAATDGQTERVAFSHDVALRLIEHGFPVPELIRTRHEGQTVLRLGGHAGPVFEAIDPVLDRVSYFGSHVSRSARIEPVTQPGAIYVSDVFAATLALEPTDGIELDYVGRIPSAKGYGVMGMYRLTGAGRGGARRRRQK